MVTSGMALKVKNDLEHDLKGPIRQIGILIVYREFEKRKKIVRLIRFRPFENICPEFWEKFWPSLEWPEFWPKFRPYNPDFAGRRI